MYIQPLKRMMIDRTIAQKGETVSVSTKVGNELVDQGFAVVVKTPDPADDKPKAEKAKS